MGFAKEGELGGAVLLAYTLSRIGTKPTSSVLPGKRPKDASCSRLRY